MTDPDLGYTMKHPKLRSLKGEKFDAGSRHPYNRSRNHRYRLFRRHYEKLRRRLVCYVASRQSKNYVRRIFKDVSRKILYGARNDGCNAAGRRNRQMQGRHVHNGDNAQRRLFKSRRRR